MRFGIMLTALSVLGLSACGGSGDSSDATPPVAPLVDDARAVSGEVGIGGGTVSVTSAGGITSTETLSIICGVRCGRYYTRLRPACSRALPDVVEKLGIKRGFPRFEP